ncbi:ABC-three component system middle component 2, partial [Mesorhizobium sp. M7A.F.Ca.MR.362.00.0.0]
PTYLDLLQSDYSMALKERARWIAQRFAGMATVEIKAVIEAKIGRWTAEFRADHAPTGSSA